MVDLLGKDKGNISLPPQLQSPDTTNYTAKELDNQPMIINMQRAMYKSLISDLEQKIQRLQERNKKLEDFFEDVEDYSNNVNIEAEKVIVELNTNIAVQTKKVEELKQKYDELEKDRQYLLAQHENKVNKIKKDFEETRERFTSEIKFLNAKINSLEDFKSIEESLVMKFNSNNEYIALKEEELQLTLKDYEYKTKMHRENLKKETYKSVLDASKDFQSDLKTTIPVTAQRMLRENIILENELVQCWNDHANMTVIKSDYKSKFGEYHKRIKEAKLQTRHRLITMKIQDLLLKKLNRAHSIVKKKLLKSFETPDNFEEKYQQLLDSTKTSEFTYSDFVRRKLEVFFHQEKIKLTLANHFKSKISFAMNACCDALSIIKYAVNIAASGEAEIVDIESFASYLLNVIEDCNSKKWVAPSQSLETVEMPSSIYTKGDLGFEPKHIEVDDQFISSADKISSQSVMSTLEILEELEKLQEKVIEAKRVSETGSRDSTSTGTSTETKSEKSRNAGSTDLVDDKQREDKLGSFYDEIFGEEESNLEYEMEDQYDYYINYEQE